MPLFYIWTDFQKVLGSVYDRGKGDFNWHSSPLALSPCPAPFVTSDSSSVLSSSVYPLTQVSPLPLQPLLATISKGLGGSFPFQFHLGIAAECVLIFIAFLHDEPSMPDTTFTCLHSVIYYYYLMPALCHVLAQQLLKDAFHFVFFLLSLHFN